MRSRSSLDLSAVERRNLLKEGKVIVSAAMVVKVSFIFLYPVFLGRYVEFCT